MAAEKDYSFKVETRKLSKTDVPALARKEKTEFEKGKKTLYSGKPVSEQAKALLEKHSANPSARFRLTRTSYTTVFKRKSSASSNSSSISSSSSKTATTAAEAGLAVSETAAASKTRSRQKADTA